MSEVKRYRIPTLPGRLTRDSVEVVEASEWDALSAQLAEARAELAVLREANANWQSLCDSVRADRGALRAVIERHNDWCRAVSKGTDAASYVIPLPAAAQGSAETCPHCALKEGHATWCGRQPLTANGERSAGAEPKP